MSLTDQLFSEGLIVVDLAVEYELNAAVLIGHRLLAGFGEIDNRKTAMPQAYAAIRGEPLAETVGAAGVHIIADCAHLVPADLGSYGMI